MLGLRASPFSKLSHHNILEVSSEHIYPPLKCASDVYSQSERSASSNSTKPADTEPEVMSTFQQGAATNGLVVQKRQHELPIHSHKVQAPISNGIHHHHTNEYLGSDVQSSSNSDIITIIQETVMSKRGRIIAEFDNIDAALLDRMTIEGFSDYITRERLSSMPHRGSLWDRVLRWAEFYALQIATYEKTIGSFVPESRTAAKQIFTLLRSLLELGENNADALNTTFGLFYKLGLSLSFLSSQEAKLSLNSHIRHDVGRAFHDIHTLVFDVAKYYESSVRGASNRSVSLDFISLYHENLDSFYKHKIS